MIIYRMWVELELVSKERLLDEYHIFNNDITFDEVGEMNYEKLEEFVQKYESQFVAPRETFKSEKEYQEAILQYRRKCYGGWTEVPYEDFVRETSEEGHLPIIHH